jgi:very-short-patch-repair endonuclease
LYTLFTANPLSPPGDDFFSAVRSDPAGWTLHRLLCKPGLKGFRFEPRQAIEGVVVDYFCRDAKIAVEIERSGSRHRIRMKEDALRRAVLRRQGVGRLGFSEEEIVQRPEKVRNRILEKLRLAASRN